MKGSQAQDYYIFTTSHICSFKVCKQCSRWICAVITSNQKEIKITNIKSNCQILKIDNAHTGCINGLDYSKFYDVIVIGSGSWDSSIQVFNGFSGVLLIQKKNSHQDLIFKIQFIKNSKLVSLSRDEILKCWDIDYQNKDLILLRQLKDKNSIYNFDQVFQQQIFIICKKYFKILDEDFKIIKQKEHSQKDDVRFRMTNQLKSLKYVLICGIANILVMKRMKKNQ